MSLTNQTCWVVGGVGVVGRVITRGLLQAGASVIVNSRSEERLEKLKDSLGNPSGLITVHGSLLPGRASRTVADALLSAPLNHVVAHGAVRWWARPTAGSYEFYEYKAGCDETFSLNIKPSQRILDYSPEDFVVSSAQLASLHFSAAQELIPRIQFFSSIGPSSYTFVTGDGSGKPGGGRTAMGEINSHHVWGLSAGLRNELSNTAIQPSNARVNCREIRLDVPTHSDEDDSQVPKERPLSEDIGILCAGLASSASRSDDNGRLMHIQSREQMEQLLTEYDVQSDANMDPLPPSYGEA
mmetsp:Transcript_17008/g.16421  ORF Transcript_17008/g.16421 Transcript_17008/m.16421 type:complete len:298 (-) Transcript_17008:453-1346(-)|eukprot:CAMPEP_0197824412 /NCGR_PEP_ID=MMETSP1437-20131217/1662_1 /TAXON_ID=49252 ORGANISM="Eucampia antarctica, Strain CCMP1452" /NCGR_SAMPLE_ID=MMETSP1437 /ASSEMBLY_ACC=CAM_ASM_001096 /LENGTH=297 /DNA_ID=CAMNT_0043424031 /DNA_START=56 /DNA_END=949 /DNA_ORIENTATION=-